ncbi:hypothetical protein HAX54_022782, partial [Datura stramonium]|nr:hypothetical protein [Datura stramonium]
FATCRLELVTRRRAERRRRTRVVTGVVWLSLGFRRSYVWWLVGAATMENQPVAASDRENNGKKAAPIWSFIGAVRRIKRGKQCLLGQRGGRLEIGVCFAGGSTVRQRKKTNERRDERKKENGVDVLGPPTVVTLSLQRFYSRRSDPP